jgi:Ca-activated chloride channel homolog
MEETVGISSSTVAQSLALFLLLTPMRPAGASTSDALPPGQGTLQATIASGRMVTMPLRKTVVHAEISGFVARVDVAQTFGNPLKSAIEVRYLFPLPERAAVDDFLLEVGERRIRGEIRRRDEARNIYETARAAGFTTSLLDQERPNIFTQSVANIPPGEEVTVHLRYIDILPYVDGAYRLLYPMVVGPRYSPRSRLSADGEPDPLYLRPGFRPGNEIEVTVDLDAGVPIRSVESESHRIAVTRPGISRAQVTLDPVDRLPNKDLMLRWEVAGELPEVGLLAHRAEDEGFFALMVQPKAEISAEEAAPKEIIFVLDQSGSMSGLPIGMSKRFMRLALETLGSRDRFNIVRFDSSAFALAAEPLPNTPGNVRRGLAAVSEMEGSGGTEMLAGFDAAFTQPHETGCIRIVLFLTDGYIGNEEDIFRVIRERRGDARIFTLGIGSSVNHHLLRGMAELGHGAYQYVRPDGHEKEAVERFQRWVTKPYLTDLEIDWGSLRVEDVNPSRLPDLYSGQTLSMVGRYLWGGTDTLIIRGRLGGLPWEKQVEVTLPENSGDHAALASIWARQRINELLMQPGPGSQPELEAQVTSLALAFRLMSPFTSFVAVDDSVVVNPGGEPVRLDQPLPMPELVSFTGCFGHEGPGRAEPLWLPEEDAPPGGTASDIARVRDEGVAPAGQAALQGMVQDTAGEGVPGAVLVLRLSSLCPRRTYVSDIEGRYIMPGLAPGTDYIVRVDYPGYAAVEVGPLELPEGRSTRVDITLRSESEVTEFIVVEASADVITVQSSMTTYSAEPSRSAGMHDTADEGNPPGFRLDGGNVGDMPSATFGQSLNSDIIDEIDTGGPAHRWATARSRLFMTAAIEEASLRVLADLADDGRLSRSEGVPAIVGLLAAQHSDGGFSPSVRLQAIATWALAAAAASEPDLPWVPEAAHKAAVFLAMLSPSCEDCDEALWAELTAGIHEAGSRSDGANRCLDPRPLLERFRTRLNAKGASLVGRILEWSD